MAQSRRFNFTKKAIENMPLPATGYASYSDTAVRGLQVLIYGSGIKTFILYRKIAGRPERIKIGPFPDMSIEDARGVAERLNSSIARGSNPAQEKRRALGEEMTLGRTLQEVARRVREAALAYVEGQRGRHSPVSRQPTASESLDDQAR